MRWALGPDAEWVLLAPDPAGPVAVIRTDGMPTVCTSPAVLRTTGRRWRPHRPDCPDV